MDGNAVAIIGDSGVLVFDANGTADQARLVIAEIRKLTLRPVRWLVYSHWHWDHWYGGEAYADEFPGVEVIAQERTRALMAGPAIAFNQPGIDEDLPAHIRDVENALDRTRDASSASPDSTRLLAHLATDRRFLEQKRTPRLTLPTRTFTDRRTIDVGGRVVQLRHDGRAITPGDTWAWLPEDRLAITGDLLINPITFALFCYPAGWIATLDSIDALDPRLIVPGHGSVLLGKALLHDTRALLARERAVARESHVKGGDVGRAVEAILADSQVIAIRARMTGGDPQREREFATYLVDWFVRRVFREMEGTLDDSIPRIPG